MNEVLAELHYYQDTHVLEFNNQFVLKQYDNNTYLPNQFIDNEQKFVLYVHLSYYHFIIDVVAQIANQHQKNPNTHFILVTDVPEKWEQFHHVKFLDTFLKTHNIKFTIIDFTKHKSIIINNFFIYDNLPSGLKIFENNPNIIQKYFQVFINKEVKPYRKIYLSRKVLSANRTESELEDPFRIDNEEVLEKYFESIGFEIVYPEYFKNFIDQINFFNEVKHLVSLSGAGLTNLLLMQDHQIITELLTEVKTPENKMSWPKITDFYFKLSFINNKTYLSISHDRSADELVIKLNNFFESAKNVFI